MVKVGIIGASGYTGAELIRLLSRHPKVELTYLTAHKYQKELVSSLYPNLLGICDLAYEDFNLQKARKKAGIFFVALPHGQSQKVIPQLINEFRVPDSEFRLIDLSGDFRLGSKETYEKWYGIKHESPELLGKAVYGLPEINREEIKKANFVTNPGCYPTSAILALAPLLKKGLIFEQDIIVDAKSGLTGAGRSLSLNSQFAEANENLQAYKVGVHQHTPEMEEVLTKLGGEEVKLTFTPHLVPMNRGILTTCYADLKEDLREEKIFQIYKNFYKDEPFVEVLAPGRFPGTKAVFGSNFAQLGLKVDERLGRIILISALDNLVKGASGQAIQNMNLMLGFPEEEGLKTPGLFP